MYFGTATSPLAPSITSILSFANDKGDNGMMPGAVHISPGMTS